MLAKKNPARGSAIGCLMLALLAAGCTPPGPQALLDGKRLLEAGHCDQAVEKLEVATQLMMTNAHAWNYLGLAHHRAGQPAKAAAAYQKALRYNPDLAEAHFNLGTLWFEQNRLDAAKSEFTTYTLQRGGRAEGFLRLGTVQLRLRETGAAEKSFQEALRLNTHHPEALNGLGLVQLQRNRPREATNYFAAAIKRQPGYRPARLNLATVTHQHLNDRPSALRQYREYLALTPRPADAEAVGAIVKSLEQGAAPPPRPAVTNVVVQSSPLTNAVKPATVATSSPPAQAKIIPPTNPPKALAVETSDVPIVKLPPEPVIKTTPDVVPTQTNQSQTPVTAPPPTNALPIAAAQSAPPAKRGFFDRMNPVNLFRRDTKAAPKPTPLPTDVAVTKSGTVSPSVGDGGSAPSSAAAPGTKSPGASGSAAESPPVFTRYTYLAPAKPAAGNRADAERAFAQGVQSQRATRLAEAAQSFLQATRLDPAYFEAHYNLALVAFEARNYRQSLSAWENALAIQPNSADGRYNFALALKAANHLLDAAAELERLLAATPAETRAHLMLGNLYAEPLQDPARARVHYQKVLDLDPRHPQATAIRYWLVAHPR